ncbi:pyridoxamine 5'-phosphate oxidase family protein [Nonomuraea sp. bgisy101]|uniref:pyridoxamine 5'-phosphate oxidase family protein n=1 Tax=Nonomuraea sp. bgisy101 TaxID=3413784 RepID=UPI003D7422AE
MTRLAYVAKDGTPRNVPIIFAWNGSEIVMCTSKNAPKLQSLSENPMVALTIDTEVHPPKILLIRGRASWTSSMASRTSISRRPAPTR